MARIAPPVDDRTYDWIIDVLTDLRTFSHANGLHKLAVELEDVALLAAAEISTRQAQDAGRRVTTRH
ncbi:hypothetical protein [Cognatishimia sp.]|uniref:hypothetical protein n=1 Tax=Cognatishimia sp. TaxID=2211648 RepID=UPI0035114F58|nr:hypothetical protein [Cognatishimia sp.]NQY59099.1 hypothetical protein [Cognatishimia sp.]